MYARASPYVASRMSGALIRAYFWMAQMPALLFNPYEIRIQLRTTPTCFDSFQLRPRDSTEKGQDGS